MKSLQEIADEYGTDKGYNGSYKPRVKTQRPSGGGHNYVDIYEAYLSRYRMQELYLLEIGLGAVGASIRMWRDYFPKGRFYGLDLNAHSDLDDVRTTTKRIDQSDRNQLENFLRDIDSLHFDIIIDDGSHIPYDQQLTFELLFPRLKKGGIYFIEDLLPNGKGDSMSGSMSSQNVINTRRLFRGFKNSSRFEQPHAIGDPVDFAEGIEQINFHCPRITSDLTYSRGAKFLFKRRTRFLPNSENLVAILKK